MAGKVAWEKSTDLELNDAFLGKTQVHPLGVLQVESTLVQLRHGVICIHQGRLFVYFTDDLGTYPFTKVRHRITL